MVSTTRLTYLYLVAGCVVYIILGLLGGAVAQRIAEKVTDSIQDGGISVIPGVNLLTFLSVAHLIIVVIAVIRALILMKLYKRRDVIQV